MCSNEQLKTEMLAVETRLSAEVARLSMKLDAVAADIATRQRRMEETALTRGERLDAIETRLDTLEHLTAESIRQAVGSELRRFVSPTRVSVAVVTLAGLLDGIQRIIDLLT